MADNKLRFDNSNRLLIALKEVEMGCAKSTDKNKTTLVKALQCIIENVFVEAKEQKDITVSQIIMQGNFIARLALLLTLTLCLTISMLFITDC